MTIEYPQIMTIEETCSYLRIPKSSLYKLAQEGKIPCQKVGRHWRFHRATLINWIAGQRINEQGNFETEGVNRS